MPRDVTFMHTWEPSLDAPNATSQVDLDSTLPQSATRENKDVATMWTMYAFWIQSVFTCPTINNNIVWILSLSLSLWLSSRGTPSCCPDLASDRVFPRLDITLGNLGLRVDYSEDLRGSLDYRPTGCRRRSVKRSLCAAYSCEETGLHHILTVHRRTPLSRNYPRQESPRTPCLRGMFIPYSILPSDDLCNDFHSEAIKASD